MITIKISNNNINERKYIIDVLLKEFLGLKYKVIVDSNIDNWEVILENGNKLIIEDHFFGKFSKDLEYLKEDNIPKKVEFSKNDFNDFIVRDNIPIIYGTNKLIINQSTITCGIDIFASSFFMLTRWEEYVNKTRDKHNRFPAYASLAYKNNFLDRPVVNEYVEMLWNMLKFLGCKQKRKKREFRFILTHDVDHAYKYTDVMSHIRELAGDILKRKDLKLALNNLKKQILVKFGKAKDPFDTYDYLMDISEKSGIKSYFFLHSSSSSKFDNNNDKFLKNLSHKILSRGHYIGYHPSYNAYNNLELFLKDKEKIENIIEHKLIFGRQHYLRFEVPITWQIWEDAKMEWDSTLSYADKEGFRCGVCYPYTVFNILTREKLKLKERPLIIMESSLINYQPNITPEQMEQRIRNLIDKIKRYKGEFVFLWHNSTFECPVYKQYSNLYRRILIDNV